MNGYRWTPYLGQPVPVSIPAEGTTTSAAPAPAPAPAPPSAMVAPAPAPAPVETDWSYGRQVEERALGFAMGAILGTVLGGVWTFLLPSTRPDTRALAALNTVIATGAGTAFTLLPLGRSKIGEYGALISGALAAQSAWGMLFPKKKARAATA